MLERFRRLVLGVVAIAAEIERMAPISAGYKLSNDFDAVSDLLHSLAGNGTVCKGVIEFPAECFLEK